MQFMGSLKGLHSLWRNDVLTSLNDIILQKCSEDDLNEVKELYSKINKIKNSKMLMNEKKKHEVDEMSRSVAEFCKNLKLNTVFKAL